MSPKKVVLLKQGQRIYGVCPARACQHFFKLYHPFSLKAKIWTRIVKFLFRIKLPALIFPVLAEKDVFIGALPLSEFKKKLLEILDFDRFSDVVLSFPVDSKRKRARGFILSENLWFFKSAWSNDDKNELEHEAKTIEWLQQKEWKSFRHPELFKRVSFDTFTVYCYHSLVNKDSKQSDPFWNSAVNDLWKELCDATCQDISAEQLIAVSSKVAVKPQDLNFNRGKPHRFCSAHGDFAPWNLKVNSKGVFQVYDWENFLPLAPYLFDPLHFFIQTNFLVNKKGEYEVASRLRDFIHGIVPTANPGDIELALIWLSRLKSPQPHFPAIKNAYFENHRAQ